MPRAELIHGECLAEMAKLPEGSVDMVLCDLPYGITRNKWDSVIPLDYLWHEYRRLCRGAVVLTAAQPFTSALVMSNVKDFKQGLVWKKNIASNFLNANRQHMARHEDVVLFASGPYPYNPQSRVGEPYRSKRTGEDDSGENYGSIKMRTDTVNEGFRKPISVLEFDREPKPQHPTQKPVALLEYLIRTYSDIGMTVLDNCMGSGTTGVACVNTGRNFIGIEQDEKYFLIAKQRIENANTSEVIPFVNAL